MEFLCGVSGGKPAIIQAGNAIDSLGTFGNFHLVAGENNNGHLVGGFVHQVDIFRAPIRPIRDGNTTLTTGQSFGAGRPPNAAVYTRNHAGVDFAGGFGQSWGLPLPNVYAAIGGYIRRYSYFWENTLLLEKLGDDGLVWRYTELVSDLPGLITSSPRENTPPQNVWIRVEQGDVIGRLIPNSDNGSAVLHLELYQNSATGELRTATEIAGRQVYDYLPHNITPRRFNVRRDLLDPTWVHALPLW